MKAWRYGLVVLALLGFLFGWVSSVEAQTGSCQGPLCYISKEEPSPCNNSCPPGNPGGGGKKEEPPTTPEEPPYAGGNSTCSLVASAPTGDTSAKGCPLYRDKYFCLVGQEKAYEEFVVEQCEPKASSGSPICTSYIWTGTGFTCNSDCFGFSISAYVRFPGFCIDVEPYPVTLVNYDTAVRNSCMGTSTGTGHLDYKGNGTPSDPRPGDLRDINFTLELRPYDGNAYVWLPKLPSPIILPPADPNGSMPYIFRWQQASHPDAGATIQAGQIKGLEEAPPDMYMYEGRAAAPYRLFWRLTYERYTVIEEERCVPGPKTDELGNKIYNCKTRDGIPNNDGHIDKVEVDRRWVSHQRGGEIPASQIQAPPHLLADLNGDGTADALWNWVGLTLRRMTENYFIEGKTYNFGGKIYWGVREGQGQIGYPGQAP